ncbi:MAG: hypothetical protein COV72_08990 [Candidatus Omnitrophica bacterium CG11_big_fil_rev_8_21_14_0_20_42_13]|uniref:Uncharacterized protein n=1 Tax=Candidatus Ghiorseimicrobium undicola TaxID=1974746 RepID=A0A2H0LVK4_9BACT|nr:MAG: hypothetical protein COV72_08990 [Candidatus Omnitrophica bacterium CG11_big_fil_rev_8_21_14_0_20_42_13]
MEKFPMVPFLVFSGLLFALIAAIFIAIVRGNKKMELSVLSVAQTYGLSPGVSGRVNLEKLLKDINFIPAGPGRLSFGGYRNIFTDGEVILCNVVETAKTSYSSRAATTTQRSAVIFEGLPDVKMLFHIEKDGGIKVRYRSGIPQEDKILSILPQLINASLPHLLQCLIYEDAAIIYFIPAFTMETEADIRLLVDMGRRLKKSLRGQ